MQSSVAELLIESWEMQNKTRTDVLFVAQGTRNLHIRLGNVRSRLRFACRSTIHPFSRVVRQLPFVVTTAAAY